MDTLMRAAAVLVSCEHASNRIPARYHHLGLTSRQLQDHIAWDRGAAILARAIARRLRSPCHLGRWSRLLVDLNRSVGHPKLMAKSSFGVRVPGNQRIPSRERHRRLELYYYPYRQDATDDILAIILARGYCLHLSVHSFVPVARGVVRRAEVGLLFDPHRVRERTFAAQLRPHLAARGLAVHMNSPYRGTSDGFTTRLRHRIAADRYVALEIETNQRLLRTPRQARRVGGILAAGLTACLDTAS
jgi:predicted N-formylglutamate amidohydrolase